MNKITLDETRAAPGGDETNEIDAGLDLENRRTLYRGLCLGGQALLQHDKGHVAIVGRRIKAQFLFDLNG